jgi:hypothetical protein
MNKTAEGLGSLHHNLHFELSDDRQVSEYSADGILQGKTQVDSLPVKSSRALMPPAVIIQSLTIATDPTFKARCRHFALDLVLHGLISITQQQS